MAMQSMIFAEFVKAMDRNTESIQSQSKIFEKLLDAHLNKIEQKIEPPPVDEIKMLIEEQNKILSKLTEINSANTDMFSKLLDVKTTRTRPDNKLTDILTKLAEIQSSKNEVDSKLAEISAEYKMIVSNYIKLSIENRKMRAHSY